MDSENRQAFPNLWQAVLAALAVPGVQLLEKGAVLGLDAVFHTTFQREPLTVLVTSLLAVPLVLLVVKTVAPISPVPTREKRGCIMLLLSVAGCLAMAAGMAQMAYAYFHAV